MACSELYICFKGDVAIHAFLQWIRIKFHKRRLFTVYIMKSADQGGRAILHIEILGSFCTCARVSLCFIFWKGFPV